MSTTSDMLFMNIKQNFPNQNLVSVKQMLDQATPEQINVVQAIPFKNPLIVLIFSLLLGGFAVDRFYLGDIGLGVAKLLLGWATFFIWNLIDIFFCYQKAKKLNYQDLCIALSNNQSVIY